jgi:uncharacterized protein (DUF433 family)
MKNSGTITFVLRGYAERRSLMTVPTGYQHIVIDDRGRPVIAGANMKVVELVLEHTAYGWSPEELLREHPHLSLGQIYSALAYYWDHREEIEQVIEQNLREVDELRKTLDPYPSKLGERLRAKGLI